MVFTETSGLSAIATVWDVGRRSGVMGHCRTASSATGSTRRPGVTDISGRHPGRGGKLPNVAANGQAACMTENLASVNPWVVRRREVGGTAQALRAQTPSNSYLSGEVIRKHSRRIISFGVGLGGEEGSKRDVEVNSTGRTERGI